MSSYPHYLEQQRLISSKGTGYGGSIYFYLTGTSVKASIYTDAGLTVPAANPVVISAGATAPTIYLDTSITYRRYIVYSNGETENLDPYTTPANVYVNNKFADLASTGTGKGDSMVGSDDGASGTLWTTVKGFISYLRSNVGSTIVGYIAPWTGAASRTVKTKLDDLVNARDFGVKGDGKYAYSGGMTSGSASLSVSSSGFTGFTSADVGKTIVVPGAGVSGAGLTTTISSITSTYVVSLAATASTTVTGKTVLFGTNDTANLQAWLNYCALNRRRGWLPNGYFLHSGLSTYKTDSWSIEGETPRGSVLVCTVDNTPVLTFGNLTGGSGQPHTIAVRNMAFDYAAPQPVTNTLANCFALYAMLYECEFRSLHFLTGYYGIMELYRATEGQAWGQTWDDLWFEAGLTGGAVNGGGITAQGAPNKTWGRIYVRGTNMAGPAIFYGMKGYNWTVDAIEINGVFNVAVWDQQAGAECHINAFKVEGFRYTAAINNNTWFYAPSGMLWIDQLSLIGTSPDNQFNPPSAGYLFTGTNADIKVGHLSTFISYTATTNFYMIGNSGFIRVGFVNHSSTYDFPFCNNGSTNAADYLVYERNAARRLSADIGDANYTVTTNGGANVIVGQTALTASRTVEIMNDTKYLYNGYTVTVLSRGAVNGANTLVIKAGGITKATISADNYAVELTWRRNPTAHNGWVITSQGTA